MASEHLVCHIGEQFCQCAICLKPFSEPKVLPCLHRFCQECLSPLFENLNAGDTFYCPLCRAESTVTEGGVKDLKRDFLVSELTNVIQLQKSFQSENQIRQCEACKKEQESAGFCSKCGGFLCQNCFTLHQTFNTSMLKDHQPVIDLKDVFSGKVKIGMEKLSQFNSSPRCPNHPENILRLSCVTCEGQQICIACTYEDHEEHKAQSIRKIAGKQREDLQKKLDELRVLVKDWESKFEKVTLIKEKLSSAVTDVRERVSSIVQEKLEKLQAERENVTLSVETNVSELKKNSISEKTRLENERNEKIKEIEKQYDELLEKHNTDTNNKIEQETEDGNKRRDEIDKQMIQLKAHCDELMNAVSKQLHHQTLNLDGLMSSLSNTQKRFENFVTTGSSVLLLANDWSSLETIPGLCFAFTGIESDIEKVDTRISELDESNLSIPKVTESTKLEEVGFIEREKHLESVIDLTSVICGSIIPLEFVDQVVFLKSSGCFVMSGNLKKVNFSAAVLRISKEGKRPEHLKRFNDCSEEKPYCLFCQIDEVIFATACDKTLGTINVKESTCNEIQVEGVGHLRYICVDQTLKQILTYQEGDKIVKVFDLNLKFWKTRNLPDAVLLLSCVVVHGDKLFLGGGASESDHKVYVLNKNDEILSIILLPGLPREEPEVWQCDDLCCSGDGTLLAHWWRYSNSQPVDEPGYIVLYTPTYYPWEITPTCGNASCLVETDGTRKVVAASRTALEMYNMWSCSYQE